MSTSPSVPDLIATARINAATALERISDVPKQMGGQTGSDAQVKELHDATAALELLVIDIYSLFEARMQHHFKRGPFSRKLKAVLLEAGQTDLAHRVHQYYLAVNVLKHGKGASYRELLDTPSSFVAIKSTEDIIADEAQAPANLIDTSVPGFLDGLTITLLEAYYFLEKKQETYIRA